MAKRGRKALHNICNIFTLLSVILFIFAGFIKINEYRLDGQIMIQKMEIISIKEHEPFGPHDSRYDITVSKYFRNHNYSTHISRIPTGYTSANKDIDRTKDYQVGNTAEVYIDKSSITNTDFKVIYNLDLFRSGELGYLSKLPFQIAVISFILGLAKIHKIPMFCKKHPVFVVGSLSYIILTGFGYLAFEISSQSNTTMFGSLGPGLAINSILLIGSAIFIVSAITIIIVDSVRYHKAYKQIHE